MRTNTSHMFDFPKIKSPALPRTMALPESSIGMAQVLAGNNAMPDNLLKLLDLGEPSFFSPGPDIIIADTNCENTAGGGHQRNLADVGREGSLEVPGPSTRPAGASGIACSIRFQFAAFSA